jgi:hypothetical protein
MTIINDDSTVVIKLEASLTDDVRVVIYDRHMFIVQAIGFIKHFFAIFSLLVTGEGSEALITG